MNCPYCTGAPFWSVVMPPPCGPFCAGVGMSRLPMPAPTWPFPAPVVPAPAPPVEVVTPVVITTTAPISDEDVERIARRVVELLRTP